MTFYFLLLFFFTKDEKYGQLLKILLKKKIIFSYSFDVQSFLISLDFCFVLFFISILKRGSFFFEGAFTMVLL